MEVYGAVEAKDLPSGDLTGLVGDSAFTLQRKVEARRQMGRSLVFTM
jgi:hypothetical protein